MGTTTGFVHIYKPADNEVFDEQLNDNANSDLIDAAILSEHNLTLAHTGAASPHTGHAVIGGANLFQGLQTVQVGSDVSGVIIDTPGLVAPGTLTGSRHILRARSYDTSQHTRDFMWRARATSQAGNGVLELLTTRDGGAPVVLWSISESSVLTGAVPSLEALFAGATLVTNASVSLAASPGIGFVFSTVANVTITLPDARISNRPITIFGPTVAGNLTVTSVFGTVFGGSANLNTGAIQNGVVASGDSFLYKSDGANWRS